MKAVTINYRGKSENYPSEHLDENVIVDIKVKNNSEDMCIGNVTYTKTNLTKVFTFAWFDEWGDDTNNTLSDWTQNEEEEHECIPLSDHIMYDVECFFEK